MAQLNNGKKIEEMNMDLETMQIADRMVDVMNDPVIDFRTLLRIIDPEPERSRIDLGETEEHLKAYYKALVQICDNTYIEEFCKEGQEEIIEDYLMYIVSFIDSCKKLATRHIFTIMPEFSSAIQEYLNSHRCDFRALQRAFEKYKMPETYPSLIVVPRMLESQRRAYESQIFMSMPDKESTPQLKAVQCTWNGRNQEDTWEGKIALYEDGWFEGLVQDPNSPYKGDRFVFGAYFPGTAIELLKITPSEVSDPFVFKGVMSDDITYDGHFNIITTFGEGLFGSFHMNVSEAELDKDFKKKVDDHKQAMDAAGKALYGNTKRMRPQFIEVLRRKYMGEGFSAEEISAIREVTDPVEADVVSQTAEAVRQRAKLPKAQCPSADGLPF